MDGFLNVLKPVGVTSHDVVMVCRGFLGDRRLGHLGTLDPLAVGVLPLACGNYRRLAQHFLGDDKRYFAEFTFGLSTDTGDTDGRVTGQADAGRLRRQEVEEALSAFRGEISQKPPAYSALKVKGAKLLDLARRGVEVQIEPRTVQVHEFRLLKFFPGQHPRGLFSMTVGRGVYVRSLAVDLGDALGCGAAVSYLLRSRSGGFHLEDARTLTDLRHLASQGRADEAFVDPFAVMPGYPVFSLSSRSVEKVSHGLYLDASEFGAAPGSPEEERLNRGPYPFLAVMKDPRGRGSVAAVIKVQSPGAYTYEGVLAKSDAI